VKLIDSMGFKQSIVATHSSEIIADVPPQSIVSIQKRERVSRPLSSSDAVQTALGSLGSALNVQLSKLAAHGRVLFVEGKDQVFLLDIAYKLGPQIYDAYSKVAVMDIGGKGGWKLALGAADAFQAVSSGKISTTLVLDRDYDSDSNHNKMVEEASKHHLSLNIWSVKEIESFFLVPSALSRIINGDAEPRINASISAKMIAEEAEALKRDAIMSMADKIQADDKKQSVKASVALAEKVIADKLANGVKLHAIVSAKQIISRLSARCQQEFNVSFGALSLCKSLSAAEVSAELKQLVSNLCEVNSKS